MHKERTSELFIFSEAFLWAFYPIVSSILVLAFSPVFALAVSTLAAAVFFGTVVALQKRWHELFIKQAWKYLIPMILLMGILLYGLLFFFIAIYHAWQCEYYLPDGSIFYHGVARGSDQA